MRRVSLSVVTTVGTHVIPVAVVSVAGVPPTEVAQVPSYVVAT